MIKSNSDGGGKNRANFFAYIAFWQVLVFVMLLCLIWVCELTDLMSVYFSESWASSSSGRAVIISIGVLICAFVMIGNTYLQQKRVVSGFLTICSYCKNIRIDNDIWEQVEGYVSKRSLAEFSHGICPACYAALKQEMDKAQGPVDPSAPPSESPPSVSTLDN